MKKTALLTLLTTSMIFAENMAVSFNIDKVASCDSPTAKMTTLNARSDNNLTFTSIGICQHKDGKTKMLVIVRDKLK